mmetsp:Transcript_36322/g.85749  ORF Transcript_36322/g.85749 Transcript_36322/m.85749 type:complete len:219 (+) Transcript_36322:706-1362(+)
MALISSRRASRCSSRLSTISTGRASCSMTSSSSPRPCTHPSTSSTMCSRTRSRMPPRTTGGSTTGRMSTTGTSTTSTTRWPHSSSISKVDQLVADFSRTTTASAVARRPWTSLSRTSPRGGNARPAATFTTPGFRAPGLTSSARAYSRNISSTLTLALGARSPRPQPSKRPEGPSGSRLSMSSTSSRRRTRSSQSSLRRAAPGPPRRMVSRRSAPCST